MRRKGRVIHLGNIDAISPKNEDWIKRLSRDVDTEGNEVPNRFDNEAKLRGEKFRTIRERLAEEEKKKGGN